MARPVQQRQGLTLVEVMLALGVIAIALLTGVELMGGVVRAQADLSAGAKLEQRMMAARIALEEIPAADVALGTALGGELALGDDAYVRAAGDSPYPDSSLPLELIIKDEAGGVMLRVPALKLKEL
jgi:prepilin-type N-terminal cleavage/methylation domain-containing protein